MRILVAPILFLLLTSWYSCKNNDSTPSTKSGILISEPDSVDYHSFSQPDEAKVSHLQLDLRVDFKEQILEGVATYTIIHKGAEEIVFDTKDLHIIEVRIGQEDEPHTFKMGSSDKFLGQSLAIPIKPETEIVTIHYKTKPTAEALQWLTPEQARQKTPFLYTQNEAITARTWIPCQDSPGVRFTYDARVRVPEGMMALMSASNPTMVSNTGDYFFTMNQPIPAYLLALAVGNLEYRPYGRKSGVYAQPNVLLSAAWEFDDTEKMIETAASLFGPFRWERFDILVLPPSFPYGGMENPLLTFVTPTVIAGDRSLTALIAHELAHSWSGNLVTNATWNDFWMNEGFTVYIERRIIESLYGSAMSRMEEDLGYQDLQKTIKEKGLDHEDTRLKGNLKGLNPGSGMTNIAYEKGYLFLRTMEELYGRNALDNLLNAWFRKKAFESATTEEFHGFLKGILMDEGASIGIDEWIYGTGLPENCVVVRSERFAVVDEVIKKLEADKKVDAIDTMGWSAMEWLHFLRHLPTNAPMADLDKRFELSVSENAEVKATWFEQCIQLGHFQPVSKPLAEFLMGVGRKKLIEPLYKALIKSEHLDFAWDTYTKSRPGYHAIARKTLDELFSDQGKKIS